MRLFREVHLKAGLPTCDCCIFVEISAEYGSISLKDPSIKEMAEQIAKDPAFTHMAQQLQSSVHSVGSDGVPQLDTNQYITAMQQVMQNPQFMSMAERLGSALMQVFVSQLPYPHASTGQPLD